MRKHNIPHVCWLCGRNGNCDPLDRHHLFEGAYRAKSERLGLVVDLCHERCHIFGPEAAHNNAATMRALHEYGQRLAMSRFGWTPEEFRSEFGKNYLMELPEPEADEAGGAGFTLLPDEEPLPF